MTEQEVRAVVEQLLSRLNAGELAMPAAQVPTPARIPEQTPEQDGVIEDIEQVDLRRQYLGRHLRRECSPQEAAEITVTVSTESDSPANCHGRCKFFSVFA